MHATIFFGDVWPFSLRDNWGQSDDGQTDRQTEKQKDRDTFCLPYTGGQKNLTLMKFLPSSSLRSQGDKEHLA